MAATIVRELDLDKLVLLVGSHAEDSKFCVMEAVAYVAGEPWSDSPKCASKVIAAIMRRLNDAMTDEERPILKPYARWSSIVRAAAVPTRRGIYLAADWCTHVAAPRAFRKLGLVEEAEKLEQLVEIIDSETYEAARPILRSAADAAYNFRSKQRAKLEAQLRKLLVGKVPNSAAAAAAAAEAAAAAAAAEAVADPAFLQRIAEKIAGKPYWDAYYAVREELRARPIYSEALKQLRGEWIASTLALVDRMILVGQEAA